MVSEKSKRKEEGFARMVLELRVSIKKKAHKDAAARGMTAVDYVSSLIEKGAAT